MPGLFDDDAIFPDKIAALANGPIGGPSFDVEIVAGKNGFEQRNINSGEMVGEWDVATGMKRRADFEIIMAFYAAGWGPAYGFLFKDYSDYQVIDGVQRVAAGGETTTQMVKTYTRGTRTLIKTIRKLAAGWALKKNGGAFSATFNNVTGVATHAALAPGDVITATGDFYRPVRFVNTDFRLQLQTFERGGVAQIGLKELRLNAAGVG